VYGLKYYLVILDDFTHYLWTFPLKQKSDTFTTLSNFFTYVATQFSCTVKAIQYDNGREFDNSSTRTFLLSKGAQLRMSCPYTSSQNGKVERIIRTIINVIHTLLIQASLPGRYWAEGLHTVVYLLNRLPMKIELLHQHSIIYCYFTTSNANRSLLPFCLLLWLTIIPLRDIAFSTSN
jgi:transposase InsO family protein